MYLPNTTWHNAPFAARFVQDAQVGALHFTEVLRLTVWFYPQNSELLHSAGVLFLGNDFLSPLINIGWMALCLLAAWSFGRPYGAGAAALLGVALILDAEMLLLYQPGDAKNDTAGLFFLLAAAAILVNAEAQRRAATDEGGTSPSGGPPLGVPLSNGALVVAGLAAGLALGTKLNLLAPFGLLTLGVIAVTAGYRVRATAIWVGELARHRRLLVRPQPGRGGQPAALGRRRSAPRPRPARHRHPRAAHRLGLPDRRRCDHGLVHPEPQRQLRRRSGRSSWLP